jgi:hypothetical protein
MEDTDVCEGCKIRVRNIGAASEIVNYFADGETGLFRNLAGTTGNEWTVGGSSQFLGTKEAGVITVDGGTVATRVTSAIALSSPLYDFNAENLTLGALTLWANAGSGVIDEATTDEGSPTVVDESGKKAVLFDGDDALTLGTPSDLDFTIGTSDFTVMVVWGATTGTTGSIITDRNSTTRNFNIAQTVADNTLVQIGQTGQFFDVSLTKSAGWVYEVAVDAGAVSTYVEGSLLTNSGVATGDNPLQEVKIGSRVDNVSWFNGSVRRIIIWNRLLTSGERSSIFTELQTSN